MSGRLRGKRRFRGGPVLPSLGLTATPERLDKQGPRRTLRRDGRGTVDSLR